VTYDPIKDYDAMTQPSGSGGQVPDQNDDYRTLGDPDVRTTSAASARSMLLTMVEFDGDLKVYFRDIATDLNTDFDLIFQNCENYPGTGNFELFWLWYADTRSTAIYSIQLIQTCQSPASDSFRTSSVGSTTLSPACARRWARV
jgi:hypothetical protein